MYRIIGTLENGVQIAERLDDMQVGWLFWDQAFIPFSEVFD